jgi:Cellulase (glycosyl hydrolase family 5)
MRLPPALRLVLLGLLAALICTLATAPLASASPSQQSVFQDDDLLIFSTSQGTASALDELQSLGVNVVRVSVFWGTVAPDPLSRTRPSFDATDPAAYPPGAWDRYDQVVKGAVARGMSVDLDVTSPAPLWATAPNPVKPDVGNLYEPSDAEFASFMHALATRYSGSYAPPSPPPSPTPPPPPPCNPLVALLGGCQPGGSGLLVRSVAEPFYRDASATPLPRVSMWTIWNEPNQPGWLDPQWVAAPGRSHAYAEASPRLYRGLLDAAWGALQAGGHGGDTILIGETAPKGLNVQGPTRAIKALHFIRQLYCLDDRYRPLRGAAAAARACPTTAAASAQFPAQHPALFHATGYAHHPYELTFAPNAPPSDPDYATTGNLPALSAALRNSLLAYHSGRGLPVYLTEFGYNTDPPNPAGVSLAQQALYLNQAEYLAYRDPAVRTTDQFLLADDAPRPGRNGVVAGYGATFQTGLEFHNGQAKPALSAYRLPIFLPRSRVRRGTAAEVWGMVRPARGPGARVQIQFASRHSRHWSLLARAVASIGSGYLDTRVRVPSSGSLRLAWRSPTGAVFYSRAASVSVVSH